MESIKRYTKKIRKRIKKMKEEHSGTDKKIQKQGSRNKTDTKIQKIR